MLRVAVVAVVVASGCTTSRYYVLPPPAPVEGSAPLLGPEFNWSLGEVNVRTQVLNAQGSAANLSLVDTSQQKRQLEERVRATLSTQTNLGAVEGRAPYSLEVAVLSRETVGLGRQIGLGLALETGILIVGTLVGAVVGDALDRPQPPATRGLGFPLGLSAGLIASTPLALGAALAVEIGGTNGEFEAELTLRRRSDRVPVASRRVSTTWRADYNGFSVERKMAELSGAALPDFERALLLGVKAMLLEVSEPVVQAPPSFFAP